MGLGVVSFYDIFFQLISVKLKLYRLFELLSILNYPPKIKKLSKRFYKHKLTMIYMYMKSLLWFIDSYYLISITLFYLT